MLQRRWKRRKFAHEVIGNLMQTCITSFLMTTRKRGRKCSHLEEKEVIFGIEFRREIENALNYTKH